MVTPCRATLNDIAALVELMREFYAESGLSLDQDWAAESFRALLDDDTRGAVWIVNGDDTPVGYIVLTVRHSMEYGGLDGFIDDFYVRPAFRRQGLGQSAVDALLAEAAQRGLKALHVEAARDKTAARELYDRLGFKPTDPNRVMLTRLLQAQS